MTYWGLSAALLLSFANRAPSTALAIRYRNLVFQGPITALTVLPGETVTLEAVNQFEGGSIARPLAGVLRVTGRGRWKGTAPQTAGLYPIHITSGTDSLTVQAFVLIPYARVKRERLNGYRIGQYPSRPLRGLDIYRPPTGFIEVTAANENTYVSPHFQLKQFVCKQGGGYPKYIVLNERLLQKLESLLELANRAGYQASTFHVMSGYRTPAYNRALGNVPYSRHTWGAAADIFIDEDADGRMDDLNGDGHSTLADAEALYRLFDASGRVTGMGKYAPTEAHGPFVHVDVRDRRARW